MSNVYAVATVQPGDLLDVVRVARRSLDEEYPVDFFVQMAALQPDAFLVAKHEVSRNVVGFLVAARGEALEARILLFAVDPLSRGRGVGRALIRAAQRRLVLRDVRTLSLEVRVENLRARRFYRRHGFAVEGLQENVYDDGGDALLMSKPLL